MAEVSPDVVDVKRSTADGMGLASVACFKLAKFNIVSRDRCLCACACARARACVRACVRARACE